LYCATSSSHISTLSLHDALPISSGMYFFPTASPKNKKCSWIAHSHIKIIYPKNENQECEITFKNGKQITIDASKCNFTFLVLVLDRKSTRLNSSHVSISYAVFCL